MSTHIKNDAVFAKTVLMPGDPLRAKYIAENYLKEYKREFDEKETSMADIHNMAINGKSIISAMGTKLPVVSWNDILILGGQLGKMPLFDDEEVSLRTVIGKNAKKPMVCAIL